MSKEEIIQKVAEQYMHLLRTNNYFPEYNENLEFYGDIHKEGKADEPWIKFILKVETAYFVMPYYLRKIIKCDFFYQNYSFWWEEYYTKRQYKNFHVEAVDLFYNNLIKTGVINKKGEVVYVKK